MPSEEELDFDDGDINTTEIGDIDADDNLYDFGLIEDESQVLTQEEGIFFDFFSFFDAFFEYSLNLL